MNEALPKYCYDRTIEGDEIRILILKPSEQFHGEISCELETRSRGQCGAYTALSYCWGSDDQKKARITISGSMLEIKHSLATALRYLRGEHEARTLWIDAICINQDNKDEKTKQVRRMAETYENSTKVIVWLGAPSEIENTSAGIGAIDALGSQLSDKALVDVPTAGVNLLPNVCGCGPMEYALGMLKLLRREWFTRLWVIQEICFAPTEVTIMCGRDEVSFWKLTHLQIHPIMTQLGLALQPQLPQDGRQLHRVLALAQEPPVGLTRQYFVAARKGITGPITKKWTLLSHLWNFRNRDCTDPRDRVYALLGISKDRWIVPLDPDYKKSPEDAYTAATKAIIETYNRLDVMGMCHRPIEDRKPGEGLGPDESQEAGKKSLRPSWVPDFNSDPTMRPRGSLTVYTDNEHDHTASGASEANPIFSERSLEMTVEGYCIDEIASLGYDNDTVRGWQGTLRRSRFLVEREAVKLSTKYGDVEDAFWRTLITNQTGHKAKARQEIEGRQFKLWWENVFSDPRTRDLETEKSYIQYQSAWTQHFHFRNFFTTHDGYMGLCPLATRVGDVVYLLPGSQTPFVLRKHGAKHQVIGECYVHGIMDGSLWRDLEVEQPNKRSAVLLF